MRYHELTERVQVRTLKVSRLNDGAEMLNNSSLVLDAILLY